MYSENPYSIEDLYQSIMHMVVNFGEQRNYPERILETLDEIADREELSRKFIEMAVEARLTMEVVDNVDTYMDSHPATEPQDIVADLIATFRNVCSMDQSQPNA